MIAPIPVFGQVVNPTTAEFGPSSDHNAISDGVPVVNSYDLGFYLPGAPLPFQSMSLGKPTIAGDGLVRVVFTGLMGAVPSPGILYEARVSAVGPGGVSTSAPSNQFMFSSSPTCTFGASPPSQSIAAGGGTANVAVTAGPACAWNAMSNASWITITAGSSGTGNGGVSYSVAANTSTSPRSGTLTVAGQTVTVNQSGTCNFSVSPLLPNSTAAGGAQSVSVTTGTGCGWTASSNATWLTITSGSSGTGSGSVNYTVAANTSSSSRNGTLTVAGQTVTVNQSGVCSFTASPASHSLAAASGSRSVSVTTTSGCAWTATDNRSWISITAGSSGTGSGTVTFSVTANTSTTARSGALTVGGQTVSVDQSGTCTFTVTPTSAAMVVSGGTASVSVTTTSGCAWTATSNATWITLTAGSTGSGTGTTTYSVAANTGAARSGTLTVAGRVVTVTQPAGNELPAAPGNLRVVPEPGD